MGPSVDGWWHDPCMTAPREIAQRLGHGECAVEATVSGHRWFGWCRCGYVSTTKTSEALAVGAVVHHVQAEIRRWQTTGRRATPAPEGDWERAATMHPHWAARRQRTPSLIHI